MPILSAATKIIVESQSMRGGRVSAIMNAQVAILQFLFADKLVMVTPSQVARHFDLSGLKRSEKKRRTVALFELEVGSLVDYGPRKHDVADAWLNLKYYTEVSSKTKVNGSS